MRIAVGPLEVAFRSIRHFTHGAAQTARCGAWYDCRMRRLLPLVSVLLCAGALAGCSPNRSAVEVSIPPGAALPPASGADELRDLADADWISTTAAASGIPVRALQAYAGAAIQLAEEEPGCRIDWATLAGVGYVESRHGSIDGGELQDDGNPTEPIYGPLLDGISYDEVADHDGGALDGNAEFDRAMGPMQFIPTTWIAWHAGDADPQNIDDSALGAARYLCYSGGDLGTADGWRSAIAAYNPAASYAGKVAEAASRYAAAA
jgi:membrane-bound lytic murein transglycosylase B